MTFDASEDDVSGQVSIDYTAKVKQRVCPVCVGEMAGPRCATCGGTGLSWPPARPFVKDRLMTLPISKDAPAIVTVDDAPYASFSSVEAANAAAKLWTGYTDGLNRPLEFTQRKGVHWPAVEGRIVRVLVKQGGDHV